MSERTEPTLKPIERQLPKRLEVHDMAGAMGYAVDLEYNVERPHEVKAIYVSGPAGRIDLLEFTGVRGYPISIVENGFAYDQVTQEIQIALPESPAQLFISLHEIGHAVQHMPEAPAGQALANYSDRRKQFAPYYSDFDVILPVLEKCGVAVDSAIGARLVEQSTRYRVALQQQEQMRSQAGAIYEQDTALTDQLRAGMLSRMYRLMDQYRAGEEIDTQELNLLEEYLLKQRVPDRNDHDMPLYAGHYVDRGLHLFATRPDLITTYITPYQDAARPLREFKTEHDRVSKLVADVEAELQTELPAQFDELCVRFINSYLERDATQRAKQWLSVLAVKTGGQFDFATVANMKVIEAFVHEAPTATISSNMNDLKLLAREMIDNQSWTPDQIAQIGLASYRATDEYFQMDLAIINNALAGAQ